MPSGLVMKLLHPKMGNTKTISIRPQQALGMAYEVQVVFEGNFHTTEAVEEWNFDLGQRFCGQLGTLKIMSKFERGKMKIVDFGVGVFSIISANQRIFKTVTTFYGVKPSPADLKKSNKKVKREFEDWLAARP